MRTLYRVALLIAFLGFSMAAFAAPISIRVDEVGLKGWLGRGIEPVRFTTENDGPPITLRLRIATELATPSSYPTASDTYEETLTIPSGKAEFQRLIVLHFYEVASVRLTSEDGRVVALATSRKVTTSQIRGHLVAVYTHDGTAVEAIRHDALTTSQVELKTRKERELDFVAIDTLESDPWYYNDARAIILAEPLVATAEQKKVLEQFVRSGGTLVVTPATAATTGFAPDYFKEEAWTGMGLGRIYDVREFSGDVFTKATDEFLTGRSTGTTVLNDVAWRMQFPTLNAMIGLAILYILMVGVLNFVVLRRLGRLELGWITVPAVALLFTVIVFLYSLSRGLSDVRLDQVATYYMDSHSPSAYVYEQMRVTAPKRGEFTLEFPPGASLGGEPDNWRTSRDRVHIGEDVVGEQNSYNRLKPFRFSSRDDRFAIDLEMMRWSFEEWSSGRFEDLKGTVTLSNGELKNSSGMDFEKAIVVERPLNRLYNVGSLGANATATLGTPSKIQPEYGYMWQRNSRRGQAYSPVVTVESLSRLGNGNKVFVGVAKIDPNRSSAARIAGVPSRLVQTKVFVVVLESR